MTGLEPLLIGAAATGGTATAAGTAATAGLFGAGGALTAGGAFSALSTGLGLFSAFQSITAGNQAANLQGESAELQALQLQSQAEEEKTRSIQEEAERRQRLGQILSTQMAMTAGRGITVDSGSSLAIADFSEQEAQEESDIAAADSRFKQRQLRSQARMARLGGRGSMLSTRSRSYASGFGKATDALGGLNFSRVGTAV